MTLYPAFDLGPGEVVLREARKHWVLFVFELLPYAVLAILPFLFPALLTVSPLFAPYAALADYSQPIARAALGVYLLIVWTSAWGAFTRYYLNLWILTDQRIVEITQHGYFNRQVSSLLLNRVQDITTEVEGALFSLLDIGNIHVQSAGAEDVFHMNGISDPDVMRDLILKHTDANSKTAGI